MSRRLSGACDAAVEMGVKKPGGEVHSIRTEGSLCWAKVAAVKHYNSPYV